MAPACYPSAPHTNPNSVSLQLTTLNVNGLGNPSKRRAIFESLRTAKNDICFLQETHSTKERERVWSTEWGGKILFAHGTSGSRGVAVLFSRSLSPTIRLIRRDSQGRFILVQLLIDGWPVTLVNIYAPTADQPDNQTKFLEDLENLLHDLDISNLILGGDFNCCLDPSSDKFHRDNPSNSHDSSSPATGARLALRALLEEFAISDVWRMLHPTARQFTFRRQAYASRLDYWFISEHLTEWIKAVEILPAAQSDHSAVSLSLQTVSISRGPGLWRFDNALLSNKDFVSEMLVFLQSYQFDDNLSSPHAQWEFFKF